MLLVFLSRTNEVSYILYMLCEAEADGGVGIHESQANTETLSSRQPSLNSEWTIRTRYNKNPSTLHVIADRAGV
jgi:hypothetical protein